MAQELPIALSYTELLPAQVLGGGAREGDFLVMAGDTVLPPRCLMCGSPAVCEWKEFLIAAPLPHVLESTAPVFRLRAGLCRQHLVRRTLLNIGGFLMLAASPGACLLGGVAETIFPALPPVAVVVPAVLLPLGGLALRFLATRQPHEQEVRETVTLVRGIHPAILEVLPAYPFASA